MSDPSEREIRDERRVVTAMFADLVGSTPLAEALEPEDVKLVVTDAVSRVIGAVEAYGGTVQDLAGDGVCAIFGAPQAHEDDPERAVRAGLRAVDDIAAYAREVEGAFGVEGFGVRVGIASGPVVVGLLGGGGKVELGALGDPLNTAARLQAQAEPGGVLVGSQTYERVEPLFVWGEPRELELKGKAEPVVAYPVTAPAPTPGSVRGLDVQTPFVGREGEMARALASAEATLTGSGRVLFFTGEPGIGKSRLLSELRGWFESATPPHGRARWIEGRCVSYGESMPYWPFRDLLRSWLGVLADEPELRVRVALRRNVQRLFGDSVLEIYPYLGALLGLTLEPDARARLAELSPEALQYRTFEVVRGVLARLAEDGPLAVALEDLHWADATSLQLLEHLVSDTETSALLLVLTTRPERDHTAWRVKEDVARELPHRSDELALEALSGDAGRELLHALVGERTLPEEMERAVLAPAEGNPFFLEELVRSLEDAGALVREGDRWRFDHLVEIEIPPTIEKALLARIDRLEPRAHAALMAASVLGRQFGLPLLEALAEGTEVHEALTDLQRLDLVREGRRWPQPEYRFKHALIQEAAYRTLVGPDRRRLHRKAAEWLEEAYAGRTDEVEGLLAHHWLGAEDEEQAVRHLGRAGDKARLEYALDEAIGYYRELVPLLEKRGERQAGALVLFKLALALHMSLRFAEANATYQRAFASWTRPGDATTPPTATLRIATSFLPNDPDPRSAIAWPNIQLCMQLFDRLVEAWPERTIVPSLAERWEISDDGLRYVFHLRDGLVWSDGEPLTAHDIEFGIKRVLNPDAPGSSVAIYFALENGQDYYLRNTDDASSIGVHALDDRTVEFRLVAPAPYFMSVMNRPDGGPQPRHAVVRDGERWTEVGRQVVSGAFAIARREDDRLVLERREDTRGWPGDVRTVEYVREPVAEGIDGFERGDVDVVTVRYTPRVADLVTATPPDGANIGAAVWSGYIAFDHADPVLSSLEVRRALAFAVDRDALDGVAPANLIIARGGIVPPALQGHTPDIVLPFDPDAARVALAGASLAGALGVVVGGPANWASSLLETLAAMWRDVLRATVQVRAWTPDEVLSTTRLRELAPTYLTGWLPGYADPEYYLRLLFHSDSRTNEGGFSSERFDDLIERARQERSDRARLDLFHQADRMAVVDRVAVIPLVYGRSTWFVRPGVEGWWEFGKSSASFGDLRVSPS
jgi:ABC-type oligopeptide transport system substrate-binding subunit/class 3 adenylate cyclase